MRTALAQDLELLVPRRRLLGWLGAAACVPFGGCSEPSAAATCAPIPEETAGPFPADGSNGPNVLNLAEVVRRDIRSSFGSLRGTAAGVPLTIQLRVLAAARGCVPLEGVAVYVWQVDREGRYSLYSVRDQNYLRGVQVADGDGLVTFQSIFPAAYFGRWPHVHFEVYPSIRKAAAGSGVLATSQVALPRDVCEQVFATEGYGSSRDNFARMSLSRDNVFRDGVGRQTPTVSGRVEGGLQVALDVAV
jgi:protocatechuate 3,4-dioxygenase beta subunit